MPFESLGAVFYSPSVVTMVVAVAICETFSEWCDLENRVRVRSRSLEIAQFDRSHTSSYSPFIITINVKKTSSLNQSVRTIGLVVIIYLKLQKSI